MGGVAGEAAGQTLGAEEERIDAWLKRIRDAIAEGRAPLILFTGGPPSDGACSAAHTTSRPSGPGRAGRGDDVWRR